MLFGSIFDPFHGFGGPKQAIFDHFAHLYQPKFGHFDLRNTVFGGEDLRDL